MPNYRGYAGVVLVAAATLNIWLLRSSEATSAFAGITFAALCLSLSCFFPLTDRDSEQPQAGLPPRRPIQTASPSAQTQTPPSQIVNAFTIDLEDYFHTEVSSREIDFEQWNAMPSRVESSVHRLLDLLDEHHAQATVFVLGWVAQRYPQLIREVASRGHEIGCHSYRHRMVNKLTPRVFMEDTRTAKKIIEDAAGVSVVGYRAPNFSITPGTEWAFDILEQLGFAYDSSVHPVWHASYANTRAPRFPYYVAGTNLLEIPIATWRIGNFNLPIGGGAYLRLLPYSYIRHGLSVVNSREWQPVTLYVHPWEIDYLQPAIHSGFASHVRQHWGTRTMEAKLHRLLSSLRFAPIATVHAHSLSANPPVPTPAAERVPFFAQVS